MTWRIRDDEKVGQITPDTDDSINRQNARSGDDRDRHQDETAAEPTQSGHSPGETQTDRKTDDEPPR